MRFDDEIAQILSSLPSEGPLFPYLRRVRAGDRATEFKRRCEGLGIKGSLCIRIDVPSAFFYSTMYLQELNPARWTFLFSLELNDVLS